MKHRHACALVAVVGLPAAALGACVGDSPNSDQGADASLDSGSLDAGQDVAAETAADACAKICNGKCVAIDDPSYGCTATSCTPCGALPHTATLACSGGACTVGTCDPAYDNLDDDAGNGCETPNPLAFSATSLAVWLKGDQGIVKGADGGVTGWTNLAGDGGVVPVGVGAPTVDTTLWPSLPGASSVSFVKGQDSFALDVSSMGGDFTTFIASARYGDGLNCVLGSNAYSSASCPGAAGAAFQICYFTNVQVGSEVYCNSILTTATANTSSGYQPALMTMWFDGSLNYFTFNGVTINDNGQAPHALLNTAAPGFLGGGAGGPYYAGLIGEVVIYSTLLTAPDRAAVQSYLKTKWKTP